MNPQDVFYVGKILTDYVPLNKYFKHLSKVHQIHRLDGSDSDGISPLHPYYSRDYRSTSHLKLRSRRTGVFPEVQVCVSECASGPRRVFRFVKKINDFSPRLGQNKSSMSQTLWVNRTQLIFYENL